MNTPGGALWELVGIGAAVALLAGLAWGLLRRKSKTGEEGEGRVVLLREFLRNPEAMIAPNYEEVGAELADWLVGFRDRNGEDAVWVRRHEDAPSTSEVFLAVAELTKAEREALMGFQADGISMVRPEEVRRTMPQLEEGRRVFGVVWD